MTLWKRKSNSDSNLTTRFRNEPYLLINSILAGVIILIFIYSGFFSPVKDNYPVVCIHEKLTGEPCISCGLSHSFSLIIRGKISEAYVWNIYGLRVFLFFALQLVMRIVFSVFYLKFPDTHKQLIIYDIGSSIVLFLLCFLPFIEIIFSPILKLFG
jgi:Protein of unknown function (DUF2752)